MAILPKEIKAFFLLKNGNIATGLTPSIIIWETGTPTIVTGGGSPEIFMTEIGGGWYKHDFPTYDSDLRYAYRVDGQAGGGPNLGGSRYAVGTNQSFEDDISFGVWEEPKSLHSTGSPETMGSTLNQILNTLVLGSGSPQIPLTVENIVSNVWSELLAGSPAPYPTGSAGGLINQIAQSAGLTPAQVTAAVWDVPAANYPSTGSPTVMGTQLSLTTENSIDILDYTELLMASQYNRTFLDKTAATLTIYANDGTTPLRVFSLRDSGGLPSIVEICERLPIAGSPLTIPPPSP